MELAVRSPAGQGKTYKDHEGHVRYCRCPHCQHTQIVDTRGEFDRLMRGNHRGSLRQMPLVHHKRLHQG